MITAFIAVKTDKKTTAIKIMTDKEAYEVLKADVEFVDIKKNPQIEALDIKNTVMLYKASSSNSNGYIKIFTGKAFQEFFFGMGFTLDRNNLPGVAQTKLSSVANVARLSGDPAKGFGPPGTLQWHKVQLSAIETSEEVIEYGAQVLGPLDKYVKEGMGLMDVKRMVLSLLKKKLEV